MNQQQFLKELEKNLKGFPSEERDNCIEYYLEYLSEAKDQAEAIENLPSPMQIAFDLMNENGFSEKVPEKVKIKLEKRVSLKLFDIKQRLSIKRQIKMVFLYSFLMCLTISFVSAVFGDETLVNLTTGGTTLLFNIFLWSYIILIPITLIIQLKKGNIVLLQNKYILYYIVMLIPIGMFTILQFQLSWHYATWLWDDMPQETVLQDFVQGIFSNCMDGYLMIYVVHTLGYLVLPFHIIGNIVMKMKSKKEGCVSPLY